MSMQKNIKKFKKLKISDYWKYDAINDKENTKYIATNLIYNLESLIDYIIVRKNNLNLQEGEYLEYFYGIKLNNDHIKYVPEISEKDLELFTDFIKNDEIIKEIKKKNTEKKKIREENYTIKNNLDEKTDKLRECFYGSFVKKLNITLDEHDEAEDYILNKINNRKLENKLEETFKKIIYNINPKANKIILKNNKIIKKIENEIKKQRKLRFIKKKFTKKEKAKLAKLEEENLKILIHFLTKNNLIDEFFNEITKNDDEYQYKSLISFFTPTIKEAKELNGEIQMSLNNIKATGYIPFSDKKFIGKDEEDIKRQEIEWWKNFFEEGNDVITEFQNTGLDFVKKIDLYNDIEDKCYGGMCKI